MLEMLTMGGGGGIPYPESGPGTKVLRYGNLEAGFFGEVSSALLLNTSQLTQQLSFPLGTTLEEFPVWLKFAYKGKFLFIAKKPLKGGVSWENLYNAGLVYGTNDNGPLAASIPQNNVNQLRIAERDEFRFLVRLMRNQLTDPADAPVSPDTRWDADTEWHKLFYKITNYTTVDQVGAKWGKYTAEELGLYGYYSMFQEHAVDLTNIINRVTNVATTQLLAKNNAHSSITWRPVLELLPADYMLSDVDLAYTTDVTLKPVSFPHIRIVTDETDIVPLSDIKASNDLSEPIIPDGSLLYSVNDAVLPVTTPKIIGPTTDIITTAAKVQGIITDENETLRDHTLTYRTDALSPITLKVKPNHPDLFPIAKMSWVISPDSRELSDVIKMTTLDGLELN